MAETMDFFQELDALGLRDLPVAYGVDGGPLSSDDVSDEDRASIEATLTRYEWSTGRPLRIQTTAEKMAASRSALERAINAERDRRIERDIPFQGVAFQADADSRALIDKSRTSALAAIVTGAVAGDLRWHGEAVDFFWIASDNARMPMDAMTMLVFGNQAAAREGLMIVAANNLKLLVDAGETIADITDDALWPA